MEGVYLVKNELELKQSHEIFGTLGAGLWAMILVDYGSPYTDFKAFSRCGDFRDICFQDAKQSFHSKQILKSIL